MSVTAYPTYTPREGSVPWKVIEFLTTHPDERLSADDVSCKFDVPRGYVHSLLGRAVATGALARTEDLADGELLYRLGSGHPQVAPKPGRHPTLTIGASADSAADAAPAPRKSFWVDVATVEIRSDVPVPEKTTARRQVDWPALLGRMAVGDSFALPAAGAASLRKAMTDAHKTTEGVKFMARLIDADSVRCWRLS